MPSAATYTRACDDLRGLVHRGLDVPAFAREVNKVLGRIVPGEGSCLQTVDPSVAMSDHGAVRWLDRLSAGARAGARLPLAITAVARHSRLLLAGGQPAVGGAQLARATVHTTDGWLVVRGSALGDGPDAPVAVTLEGARPPRWRA